MVGLQVLVLAIGVRIPVLERARKNTLLGVFLMRAKGKRSACALRGRDEKAGAMCERSEHREARPERLVSTVA